MRKAQFEVLECNKTSCSRSVGLCNAWLDNAVIVGHDEGVHAQRLDKLEDGGGIEVSLDPDDDEVVVVGSKMHTEDDERHASAEACATETSSEVCAAACMSSFLCRMAPNAPLKSERRPSYSTKA